MDALTITAIVTSLSGLAIAVCTHVKHSKCWILDVETRDTNPVQFVEHQPIGAQTPTQTPIIAHKSTNV